MTAWKLVYPSSPLRSKVTVKFQPLIPSVEYLILYMLVAAGCFSERNLMAAITSGQFSYRLLQYQQEVSTPSVMKVRLQTVSLKKFILYVAALSPLLLFSYLLSCRVLPTAYSKPRSSQFSIGLNSSTAGISITGSMGLFTAGSFGGFCASTFNTQERVSTKRNADRTMTVLLIILLYQLIDKIIAARYIGQILSVNFIQERCHQNKHMNALSQPVCQQIYSLLAYYLLIFTISYKLTFYLLFYNQNKRHQQIPQAISQSQIAKWPKTSELVVKQWYGQQSNNWLALMIQIGNISVLNIIYLYVISYNIKE